MCIHLYVPPMSSDTPVYKCTIKNTYPHNWQSYTQGFLYHEGHFYESTGWWGCSCLLKNDISTGVVLQKVRLPFKYFAEGLTIFDNKLYQLTLHSKIGFIYDLETFEKLEEFPIFTNEGWGLEHYNNHILQTDGSNNVYIIDPQDGFKIIGTQPITVNNTAVSKLNELEVIGDKLYANLFLSYYIAVIDLNTWKVEAYIDIQDVTPVSRGWVKLRFVPNGIAYDSAQDRIFLTGKCWNKIFEVEIVSSAQQHSNPKRRIQAHILNNPKLRKCDPDFLTIHNT